MSHQDIIEKLWDQRNQINFIEDNEAKKMQRVFLTYWMRESFEYVKKLKMIESYEAVFTTSQ